MRTTLIVLLLLVLVTAVSAAGQTLEATTLRGLTKIHVGVEHLAPDAARLLSVEQLQTDVELRLRQNGITVVDVGFGIPLLMVNVNAMKMGSTPRIIYYVELTLNQVVTLLTNELASAVTWSSGAVAFGPESDFGNDVRSAVRDQVDRFINDYLSVNPKK